MHRHLTRRLPPDPELLVGVEHPAGVDHRLVVTALERHRTAVHPAQELAILKVGQVATDRLGRDPELLGEGGDIDRTGGQGEAVDLPLTLVLERPTARLGGRHGVRFYTTQASTSRPAMRTAARAAIAASGPWSATAT